MEARREIGDFDAAAGFQDSVGFTEERGPFGGAADGARHAADMDEVDAVVFVEPGGRDVVDFEIDVRRHPGRLQVGLVDAGDLVERVSVAHIDGPDAGAGAHVNDALGDVCRQGCYVKGPVEDQRPDVVLEIEAVLFGFVDGQDGFSAGVVAVAMGFDALEDGRAQGRGDGRDIGFGEA